MAKEVNSIHGFLEKYGKEYDEESLAIILDYIENPLDFDYDFIDDEYPPSPIVMQLYHAIGRDIPGVADRYDLALDVFKRHFPNPSGKILDVAAGHYPAFGYDVAKLFRRNVQVTCLDPNLVCNEGNKLYENVDFLKQPFTRDFNINGYDIIVSMQPHAVTIDLLNCVLQSNKDFLIIPCRCCNDEVGKLVLPENRSGLSIVYEYAKQQAHLYGQEEPSLGIHTYSYAVRYTNSFPYVYRKK